VVVCFGFSYDLEVVSHGFASDITKTDVENEERLCALVDDTEGPSEGLEKLFEPDVLPPEVYGGYEEGGAGEDGGNGSQGL